jgi:hypothetical protein
MGLRKSIFISFILLIFPYHSSFSQTYSDQDCLSCHGKPEIFQITREGTVRPVYVNPEEWSQDVHRLSKMRCVDCHLNANPYLHFREGFIDVDCARCHPEEEEEYQKNIHLTFSIPSPNKEFPLCFHCHTKHHVLRHDNPFSSINERNVGKTCGQCHAEVMVKGILKGASLGKISGHRKGDLGEKFDMKVCINCHYEDSAHGAKRVYKDFCSRCHNVYSKGEAILGPIHLNSQRWIWLNYLGGSLLLFLFVGTFVFISLTKRKRIINGIKSWHDSMKIEGQPAPEKEEADQEQDKQSQDMGNEE